MGGREPRIATEESFVAAQTREREAIHHDREIVTFRLAGEHYGLDIRSMREIVKLAPVTEVPRVPAFVLGVVTVRGQLVPVIDLRRRLGLEVSAPARSSRMIVVLHGGEPYGLVVDEVFKVMRLRDTDIETGERASGGGGAFLAGVARPGDELVVMLDLDAVFRFSIAGARRARRERRGDDS